MQVYTKLLSDLTQQLQDSLNGVGSLQVAFPTGLRPSRNVLICAGATAAACVAVGAFVKLLHGRSTKAIENGAAKEAVNTPLPKPTYDNVNWQDKMSDIDTDTDSDFGELPAIALTPNVHSRMPDSYFMPIKD